MSVQRLEPPTGNGEVLQARYVPVATSVAFLVHSARREKESRAHNISVC